MIATEPAAPVRLQKALAQAGVGSRRACEGLIAAGRVSVNGATAVLGQKIGAGDAITVDGKALRPGPQGHTYYALNKPRGVVSTVRDEWRRRTVLDVVQPAERVYPVGRLDADSEGLVLLTNDGELAHRLTHPRYQAPKVYEVWAAGKLTDTDIGRLLRGVKLDDGRARAAEVSVLAGGGGGVHLRLVMTEGRKHEVRRMLAAVGHEVTLLRRTAIATLSLGALRPGEWRVLSPEEVAALRANVGLGDTQ